jgi:uncharacterized membrane protein YqjE
MLASARQLAINLLAHLRTRVTLLKLEIEREKVRLGVLIVSVALGLMFGVLAVVMGSFGIVAYYWDTDYRMQVVWLLTAFFLAVSIGCWMVFRAKLKTRSALFESSLDELHKDQEALEQLDEYRA